jgi:hypothetical protein
METAVADYCGSSGNWMWPTRDWEWKPVGCFIAYADRASGTEYWGIFVAVKSSGPGKWGDVS